MTTYDTPVNETSWQRFWNVGGFWRALLLTVVYLALYVGAGLLVSAVFGDKVNSDNMFGDPASVFYGLGVALIVGSILLLLFTWSVNWFKEIFGPQPIRGSWWMWILPGLVIVFNVLRYLGVEWADYAVSTVLMTLFVGLLVGLAEELIARGLIVNMLRKGGYREWVVMFVSSLFFALMHSVNAFGGQEIGVVAITVLSAFTFGVAMYMLLRVTGNIIWPILAHASTDPSLFLLTGGVDETNSTADPNIFATLGSQGNIVIILLGFVLLWFVRGKVQDVNTLTEDRAAI